MREGLPVRDAVEQARRRQDDIDDDRLHGGRLGDDELTAILLAAYPSLTGQVN
jgi:hypothetical protein